MFKLFTGSLKLCRLLVSPPARLAGLGNGKVQPFGCLELICTNRNGGNAQCNSLSLKSSTYLCLENKCAVDKLGLVVRVDVCKTVSDQKLLDKYSDVFSSLDRYKKESNMELKQGSCGMVQHP